MATLEQAIRSNLIKVKMANPREVNTGYEETLMKAQTTF